MSKKLVDNSVTAKLEMSSMSSHSSSKNKFKSHRYIMMTQVLLCELNPTPLAWAEQIHGHTQVSIASELLKCFILITGSTELILDSQAGLSQSEQSPVLRQYDSTVSKPSLLVVAIDLHSSYVPSQLPILAERKGAMGHAVPLQGS